MEQVFNRIIEIIDSEIEKYNPNEKLGVEKRVVLVSLKKEILKESKKKNTVQN